MICIFVDWARFVALCKNLTSKVVVHMFDKHFRDLGKLQKVNVNSGTQQQIARSMPRESTKYWAPDQRPNGNHVDGTLFILKFPLNSIRR